MGGRWVALTALLALACGGTGAPSPDAPDRLPSISGSEGVIAVARLDGTSANGVIPLREVFDASGSSDSAAGASLSRFVWDFGDGSPVVPGVQVEHVYSTPGDYLARLTVSDSMGRAGSVTLAIHAGVDHGVEVAFAPLPKVLLAPSTVILDASGSRSKDPNARIVRCDWTFDDGSAPDGSGCTVSHVFPLPGRWNTQVTVRDSDGFGQTATLVVPVGHDPKPLGYYFLSGTISHFGTLSDGTLAVNREPPPTGGVNEVDLFGDGFASGATAYADSTLAFAAGDAQVLWLLGTDNGSKLYRVGEHGEINPLTWSGDAVAKFVVGRNGIFLSVTTSSVSGNYADGVANWTWSRPPKVDIDQIAFAPRGGAFVAGRVLEGGSIEEAQLGPGPFLLELGPKGKVLWAHPFGPAVAISWTGLTTSAAGTLVAVGKVRGTILWGPAGTTARDEPFLLTAEPDGQPRWLRTFDADDGSPAELVVDPAGQAIVRTEGALPGGFRIVKWNLAGDRLWSEEFSPADGTPGFQFAGIGLAANHTVAVAVSGQGTFDFGGTRYPSLNGSLVFTVPP